MDFSKSQKIRLLATLLVLVAGAVVLFVVRDGEPRKQYYINQGKVFGTYYNIRYEATNDLHDSITACLERFDASLSTFNPHSTISVLNQGRDTVWDPYFSQMYATAMEITEISHGAFDITVAPLVNAWGFGFKNKENITPELIDSLRQVKNILDASAIAKGQGCDVVAALLRNNGCTNYLVDIGGEVVLHGVNAEGKPWRVGITKPIDDTTGTENEIQQIIAAQNSILTGADSLAPFCMATSGNYRQFYYEGGMRRSHTIDPRTGYPVNHNLLSATVICSSCMRADALATSCMVLGADSALSMISNLPDAECYLICSTPADTFMILTTSGFPSSK